MFNFVFDREELGRPYPNLAPPMDASNGYHGMGDSWPYIVPCRLLYFAQDHGVSVGISYVDQPMPPQALYPVGIGWFDFELDYFARMSVQVLDLLRNHQLRVLFYYHEGDNPRHEQQRLDALCDQHQLPRNCYIFVSGNTAARGLDQFVYFADHELFYWRNGVVWNDRPQPGCEPHARTRQYQFTVLNRVHKWWRATIMTHLQDQGILNHSIWSYGNQDCGDRFEDNPIEIDSVPGLRNRVHDFVAKSPYACDDLDSTEHNSHWIFVPEHFDNSYFNVVLETHFDADGSGGAFLTEKTFKPMRHGQPFVLFGPPGSLGVLRDLGYRVFDGVLDNSYDLETNNTKRFHKVVDVLKYLQFADLNKIYKLCWNDIVHNHQLMIANKAQRLENLWQQINCKL